MDQATLAVARAAPFLMSQAAPGTGAEHDALNAAVIDGLRSHDDSGSLLGEFLEAFVEDVGSYLDVFRTAVAREDAPTLRRTAQRLKVSARHLGASGLAALCGELESVGADGAPVPARALLAPVEEEVARVSGALRAASRRAA